MSSQNLRGGYSSAQFTVPHTILLRPVVNSLSEEAYNAVMSLANVKTALQRIPYPAHAKTSFAVAVDEASRRLGSHFEAMRLAFQQGHFMSRDCQSLFESAATRDWQKCSSQYNASMASICTLQRSAESLLQSFTQTLHDIQISLQPLSELFRMYPMPANVHASNPVEINGPRSLSDFTAALPNIRSCIVSFIEFIKSHKANIYGLTNTTERQQRIAIDRFRGDIESWSDNGEIFIDAGSALSRCADDMTVVPSIGIRPSYLAQAYQNPQPASRVIPSVQTVIPWADPASAPPGLATGSKKAPFRRSFTPGPLLHRRNSSQAQRPPMDEIMSDTEGASPRRGFRHTIARAFQK